MMGSQDNTVKLGEQISFRSTKGALSTNIGEDPGAVEKALLI
jgi:hypothetical protein